MLLLDFLQNLSLPFMFVSTLVIGIALCWIILVCVRCGIRLGRMDLDSQVPMRDMIAPISAMFALMLAFSAAGIWNDALQANSAVQREANALENVVALASSLPADLAENVKDNVGRYGRQVVDIDWPAMARKIGVNDQVYDVSDRLLVEILNLLSREHERLVSLPMAAPLLGQIIEARNARLSRITLANGGVSRAQWLAMVLLASAALVAVAVCHNHHFGIQVVAMNLYAFAAVAALFVILAHDRPFVGIISVSPAPLLHLATTP